MFCNFHFYVCTTSSSSYNTADIVFERIIVYMHNHTVVSDKLILIMFIIVPPRNMMSIYSVNNSFCWLHVMIDGWWEMIIIIVFLDYIPDDLFVTSAPPLPTIEASSDVDDERTADDDDDDDDDTTTRPYPILMTVVTNFHIWSALRDWRREFDICKWHSTNLYYVLPTCIHHVENNQLECIQCRRVNNCLFCIFLITSCMHWNSMHWHVYSVPKTLIYATSFVKWQHKDVLCIFYITFPHHLFYLSQILHIPCPISSDATVITRLFSFTQPTLQCRQTNRQLYYTTCHQHHHHPTAPNQYNNTKPLRKWICVVSFWTIFSTDMYEEFRIYAAVTCWKNNQLECS